MHAQQKTLLSKQLFARLQFISEREWFSENWIFSRETGAHSGGRGKGALITQGVKKGEKTEKGRGKG